MSTPQQPAAEVRLGGVKAAIWLNESDDGRTYHTATFSRIYRNDEGEWRSTGSFRANDLLLLAKVADRTHSRILELRDAARAAPEPPDPDEESA